MRNLKLLIAYDGADFHGWQRQPGLPTVQTLIEDSIRRLIGEAVSLHGSGRTDAGAHASGQVANFKTSIGIPCENLMTALNRVLPPTVRIRSVSEAPEEFHSRYSARSKLYRYRIFRGHVCPPFFWRFVHQVDDPLDIPKMTRAAHEFVGEHDFTSFAATEAGGEQERESKVRKIFSSKIYWNPRLHLLTYEIRGSGFLHHMVRNIAGMLIEVGKGRREEGELPRILQARDRRLAGPTAPACGLWLVRVEY